jgi:hypothetical protein
MKSQMFDVKSLIIGLLLGICAMLVTGAVRGDAPQKLDADYRYQISAVKGQSGTTIYILDHETNKIYSRSSESDWSGGVEVKRFIEGH